MIPMIPKKNEGRRVCARDMRKRVRERAPARTRLSYFPGSLGSVGSDRVYIYVTAAIFPHLHLIPLILDTCQKWDQRCQNAR